MLVCPLNIPNSAAAALKPLAKSKGFQIKRIYEEPEKSDGFRVLVDRLWPRGLSKEIARIDLWFKEIAPSDSLRRWFNHEPEKWAEFKKRYFAELKTRSQEVSSLVIRAKKERVTLLFAAKDLLHNHALALKEYLGKT